ncbi:Transcription initiation factor TFIID subunit 10 [Hondaea fermentalgiana]|uniref:Transcription initiation factor TFIID subunit 10 n=1 Tax=Hondaea fermentalgiana TaxID=2315210 RepID=A0A2R5GPB0_9STRA|nr:Transcription initiation factor TFIID subunit 10 [Hondaea fermentalgiana]|eukprot:GBG32712.1 Transcription initiation factor TFIID subunit 10 [Hondaea fermentalgiana]
MASSDGTLAKGGSKPQDLLEAARTYEPLIPAAVVDYYLKRSGCIMKDEDLVAIVGLAAQKLACDIATETSARWFGREGSDLKRKASQTNDDGEKKPKLTSRDLEGSLLKIGVNSDPPPYFIGPDG